MTGMGFRKVAACGGSQPAPHNARQVFRTEPNQRIGAGEVCFRTDAVEKGLAIFGEQ
jgi:hypothetical protein